jgi:hypothetical protein
LNAITVETAIEALEVAPDNRQGDCCVKVIAEDYRQLCKRRSKHPHHGNTTDDIIFCNDCNETGFPSEVGRGLTLGTFDDG